MQTFIKAYQKTESLFFQTHVWIISFYHSFHKTQRNEPRHEKTVFFVCKQQQCATRRSGECLRSLPGLLH